MQFVIVSFYTKVPVLFVYGLPYPGSFAIYLLFSYSFSIHKRDSPLCVLFVFSHSRSLPLTQKGQSPLCTRPFLVRKKLSQTRIKSYLFIISFCKSLDYMTRLSLYSQCCCKNIKNPPVPNQKPTYFFVKKTQRGLSPLCTFCIFAAESYNHIII